MHRGALDIVLIKAALLTSKKSVLICYAREQKLNFRGVAFLPAKNGNVCKIVHACLIGQKWKKIKALF